MKAVLSSKETIKTSSNLLIPGSKSISNRLLILQALYPKLCIENISDSDDSKVLLQALKNSNDLVNVGHAGTAMRFLTAYLASQKNRTVTLTGSSRMLQRPLAPLVSALQKLGASISYKNEKGYPPLYIEGKTLEGGYIEIEAGISSQFISALILIAPSLAKGMQLHLKGTITSLPYLEMTVLLLNKLGVTTAFHGNIIDIKPKPTIASQTITVEPDWSSASYFYSLVALSQSPIKIQLLHFTKKSMQGDAALPKFFEPLGVSTVYTATGVVLQNDRIIDSSPLHLALLKHPDLAQTIAVTAVGLGKECHLSGLHTLKIKETDRLKALQTELRKLGANASITDDTITISPTKELSQNTTIATYDDHRMAMAFAPLAMIVPIEIENPNVVTKSFTTFWKELSKVGISVTFQE